MTLGGSTFLFDKQQSLGVLTTWGQKCWKNVAMAFVGEEIDDHAHPLLIFFG
jgi:hypothetical protein